jgi:hypothetical protein
MSDGPHRSLPMRRGWKRVAEWADLPAFEITEIRDALIPALDDDCCQEVSRDFLECLQQSLRGPEGSASKNDVNTNLENLREKAGSGMGGVVLDYAIQIKVTEPKGSNIVLKAIENALTDRAARGSRQVEEHYCRESSKPRAGKVRDRIEKAISDADISGLALRVFNNEPRKAASRRPKRKGLDDGVKF